MDPSIYFQQELEFWNESAKLFIINNENYIKKSEEFHSKEPVDLSQMTHSQVEEEMEELSNYLDSQSDVSWDSGIIFDNICDSIAFSFNWKSPGYIHGMLPLGSSKQEAVQMLIDFCKNLNSSEYKNLRRVVVVASRFLYDNKNITKENYELIENSIDDFSKQLNDFFKIKKPKYPDFMDFGQFLERNKNNLI